LVVVEVGDDDEFVGNDHPREVTAALYPYPQTYR
jgi:hypothetical protein